MKNDNHIKTFIEKCREIDFSVESVNRDKNLKILKSKLKSFENERETNMNKKIKRPTAIIVAAAVLICFSVAVYGQDVVRVIKTVTLGNHASFSFIDKNTLVVSVPLELQEHLYSEKGEWIASAPNDGVYYDKDGNKVNTILDNEQFFIVMEDGHGEVVKPNSQITFTDFAEGKGYFICDTLSPSYLPEGFAFDRIGFYTDSASQESLQAGSHKYMSVYYSNGKDEIYSQIRFMDEETAFESDASENIQKTKINGHDAVIDISSLNIQIGDVMYLFFTTDGVTIDELVKIAESLE